MTDISKPIKDLGKKALSKTAGRFVDFIITKYTGKSTKVFEAEGDVEADKVKERWEKLEKPLWLEAEAKKINRQYSNLGSVLSKSAPLITIPKNQISDDNDVFWGFIEHSKEISNEQMQDLIAKIIAGEYNSPGTYAMSTLQAIKMLGKNELELLERMCGLLVDNERIPQELFSFGDNVQELMSKIDIDFGSLQMLQNLGLFLPNEMARSIKNPEKRNFAIKYFDKHIIFTPENENFEKIKLPGFYGLSIVGGQILKHLNPPYVDEYLIWLKSNYKIPNYKILEN